MDGKGMMAVVRGTPDAGLMVTLVDGGRQYTLMPQAEVNGGSTRQYNSNNTLSRHSQYSSSDVPSRVVKYDSGSQVMDDQYTSNYKIEYCHAKPTSPPVEVREFPPQRAQHQPGQGNFQVGGYSPPKSFASRTITNWNDRGSTPLSRVSTKSNAFENSLRKYPSMTPDTSSEVVERLISFSKETRSNSPPRGSRLKPTSCVACYQVTEKNRYPKYINSNKTWRKQDSSPTRNKCLLGEYGSYGSRSNSNSRHDAASPAIQCDISNYRIQGVDEKMQGGNVASNVPDDAEMFIDKSPVDMSLLNFEDNKIIATTEGCSPLQDEHESYIIQNDSSMQTKKNVVTTTDANKRKSYRKLKKIKGPMQSHTKYSKLKHKPKLHDNDNKVERKRLKVELLNLIRQFNSNQDEDKIEIKIKTVLCRILDCTLDPKKSNNLKKDLNKYFSKNCDKQKKTNCTNTKRSVDGIKEIHDLIPNKKSKEASEIHRVIKEEMLPILKYHVFKEHENKVLKFILSKIIKDIVEVMRKIGVNRTANSNNSLEFQYHLDKLKEICGNKKILYNMATISQVKKYRRYLNALRKLVKCEVPSSSDNGNLIIGPVDYKLQSIINIYKSLKKIQSSSYLQAQYVTNMLLNQFCTIRKQWNEDISYRGTVQKRLSTQKCLSDTYLMLRDSSRNKSTLTKSKIDKMNLYTTKLLTSIKNNFNIETHNTDKNCKHDSNHLFKRTICVNDISFPITFEHSSRKYEINKEETLDRYNNSFLLPIEEKVNSWLNKFGNDSLRANNNAYNYISKNLSRDLANQLNQIKMKRTLNTIKLDNVANIFRCVICKHLFVTIDDQNFELAQKVSELIEDLFTISNFDVSQINKSHHQHSQAPSTTIDNKNNTLNFLNPTAGSQLIQAGNSLIEDIYLKVPFCDESIRQDITKQILKQVGRINTKSTSSNVSQDQTKYLEETKNRSGVINVALASAKSVVVVDSKKSPDCDGTCTASSNRNESNTNVSKQMSIKPNESETNDDTQFPDDITRQQLYENCVETFRNYCVELPIIATKPELIELAREGVLHNLIKIFCMLLENTEVEENHEAFEFCFKDDVDGILDMLPQTDDMLKMRGGWKTKVVKDAVKIFKTLQKINLKEKPAFYENESTDEHTAENQLAQQLNILRTVDQYLMSANYQEPNSLKVKIYMQRLINRANEVYESMKPKNVCSKVPEDNINNVIYKELDRVPKPNDDITKEEMDLVKLSEEVEQWFNGLPVRPEANANKKLSTQVLTQKIHGLERHLDANEPSGIKEVKHEICMFLCNMIPDFNTSENLNISYMIEDLFNRVQRVRLETSIDYDVFKNDLPFNSTHVQNKRNLSNINAESSFMPFNNINDNENNRFNVPNQSQNYFSRDGDVARRNNIVKLRPIAKTAAKGILGTSQMPGPSNRDGCCSKPKHSPETVSLFTPTASSSRRNTYEPDQVSGKWQQFSSNRTDSINNDGRASAQFYRYDHVQNQTPNMPMRDDVTRFSIDPNNFIELPRKEAPRMQSAGPTYGTTSTAPVPPVLERGNGGQRDYRNSFRAETERDRDENRVRCRCGDPHFRRRRRYECCCEDYFSLPHCCISPYDDFY